MKYPRCDYGGPAVLKVKGMLKNFTHTAASFMTKKIVKINNNNWR